MRLGPRVLVGFLATLLAMSLLALLTTAGALATGAGSAGTAGRLALAAVCLAQVAACVGLLILATFSVVRPLGEIERSAMLLARGELQRPVVVSATAMAELRELQLAWEEMRRALVTKLRSSTELNLQLESEVARRSAELSRRNTELSEALERLRTTRDELVRTEKLAAVGRIAASVTSAISEPIGNLAALPAPLLQKFSWISERLERGEQRMVQGEAATELAEMDGMLEALLGSAMRVRDIVRAMRVYARPQEPAGEVGSRAGNAEPEPALEEVLRLLQVPPVASGASNVPNLRNLSRKPQR